MLTVPLERSQVDQKLIAGAGKPSPDGPFPDAAGLAQALRACGQDKYEIISGDSHWEAAAFRSGDRDLSLIRCVAKLMPTDFSANYTSDHAVTITSQFEPVQGI